MLRRKIQFTMATTPRRPTAPSSESAAIPNLVRILTGQNLLSTEEREQIERYITVQQLSEEAALSRLGKLSEDEITEAVAKEAELPYLKINPLDLDLDVGDGGASSAFRPAAHHVRRVQAWQHCDPGHWRTRSTGHRFKTCSSSVIWK